MKRVLPLLLILLAVGLLAWGIHHRLQISAKRKREAGYQTRLRLFSQALKPGMTRNQVKFVMGTPPITDPFRHDRWDYIYTLTQNHREVQHRHIALFFEGDQLAKILDDEAHPARGPG